MKKRFLLPLALAAMLTLAIFIIARVGAGHPYQVPPGTGDGWATASLQEVGMAEEPITALLQRLDKQQGGGINSLLIVKDGLLVLESYYPGDDITINDGLTFTSKQFDRDTLHCLASASKSVTSIMFGIASDQGSVSDLDERVFDSFPEYADLSGGEKSQLTLRHMLNMTAGFPWDEDTYAYTDERNDLNQMYFSPDPVRYMLEKPLLDPPGEVFRYGSGVTNLLGEILNRKTGKPLAEFAGESLFLPLGITDYQWLAFPEAPEMAVASSLLYLRPRDMAKIGQLMLDGGVWNGRQIVSADWVKESTDESVPLSQELAPVFEETGYGYQWWRGRFKNGATEAIFAGGWGGQFIFILPKLEMVVVLTGSNYTGNYANVLDLVNRYLLGSIYGSDWETPDYGVTLEIPLDAELVPQVHSGPGDSYPTLGELEKGREISVVGWNGELEINDAWLQISPSRWVALEEVMAGAGEGRILDGNLANLPVVEGP
jgi:CubicO group peptidase (beta-lactamase class C family)